MGWRRGEVGGVDREDERVERPGDVRGEAVKGEGEGVAGGVGMVSLGFGRSEVDAVVVADGLGEERPALRVVGDEEMGFGADALPVSDGSMAENGIRQPVGKKNKKTPEFNHSQRND